MPAPCAPAFGRCLPHGSCKAAMPQRQAALLPFPPTHAWLSVAGLNLPKFWRFSRRMRFCRLGRFEAPQGRPAGLRLARQALLRQPVAGLQCSEEHDCSRPGKLSACYNHDQTDLECLFVAGRPPGVQTCCYGDVYKSPAPKKEPKSSSMHKRARHSGNAINAVLSAHVPHPSPHMDTFGQATDLATSQSDRLRIIARSWSAS
eukprot:363887-Chlamydomonas_euryale.AAC.14